MKMRRELRNFSFLINLALNLLAKLRYANKWRILLRGMLLRKQNRKNQRKANMKWRRIGTKASINRMRKRTKNRLIIFQELNSRSII